VDLLATEGWPLDDATERTLEPFLEVDTVDRLRFRNGLVRDVAYETMAYRTGARLHHAAGEMLEALTGGVGSDVPVLAYHFWRAGDHARAWRYSLRSAARARAVAAHADAATLIERALEAARSLADVEDDERMEQWLQLGDVRDQAGMLDLALDAYRAAARFIPAADGIGRAELFLRRAATHERAGLYSVALREATRARHVLDGARATNVISWASTMLGEPGAERWAYQAMALYEEAGDLVGQADMANNLGVQAYYAGRWEETLALYERSRAACERVGDVIDAAGTDANIGEVLVNQGRLDEAESVLADASRVLRASGHRWGGAFVAMHQGRILMARDDLAAAEEALTRVLDQFLALGRAASAYETSLHLADCIQRAGRPEQALDILARAARLTTDDVSIFDAAHDRIAAAALAAANRWEEATLALESGIRVARERGLEYELSLMLAAAADSPVPVNTGSDEPAAAESARLLAQLGVVAGPHHRHIGSPAPS
jgi:tetratricopeptide (TPR) repeat protein